jgi:iron(III) transport system permease protein
VLVFLSTMKELPATLLLRPIGFDTLATEVWTLTTVAAYSRAALPALLLIVLSAPFVYLLTTRRLGVDAHG